MSNLVQISGQVSQLFELRYTPSGVPVRELEIIHQSTVLDGDFPKNISFHMKAKIVGDQALVDLSTGQEYEFVGFLAPLSQKSKYFRFHIQKIFNLNVSKDTNEFTK